LCEIIWVEDKQVGLTVDPIIVKDCCRWTQPVLLQHRQTQNELKKKLGKKMKKKNLTQKNLVRRQQQGILSRGKLRTRRRLHKKRSASRMAPIAAVADEYFPRGGALKMPPRLKVCRAFEIIFAARPVRSLRSSRPPPVVLS
jgi:hypothetical protein